MNSLRKIITLAGLFLLASSLHAQYDLLIFQLRDNVRTAFDQLQKADAIYVEDELKDDFALNYLHGIRIYKPENCVDEIKADEIIRYYYSPDGIFEILAEWKADTIHSDPLHFISKRIDPYVKKIKPNDTIDMDEASKIRMRYLLARHEYERKYLSKQKATVANPDRQNQVRQKATGDRQLRTAARRPAGVIVRDTIATTKNPREVIKVDPKNLKKYQPLLPPNPDYDNMVKMSLFMSKNKYATLLIDEPDLPNASIYLDKKFIDTVENVKNGILVRSKHLYNFELQLNDTVLCQNQFTLKPNEQKATSCKQP